MKELKLNVIVLISIGSDSTLYVAKAAANLSMTAHDGKLWVFSSKFSYIRPGTNDEDKVLIGRIFDGAISVYQELNVNSSRVSALTKYYLTQLLNDGLDSYFPSYLVDGLKYPGISIEQMAAWVINDAIVVNSYDTVAAVGLAACQPITGSNTLLSNMLSSDFRGASGKVIFDANGDRDTSTQTWLVFNFRVDNVTHEISGLPKGVLELGSAQFNLSSSIYFGATMSSVPPLDVVLPPHEKNFLPLWALVIGYAEVVLVLALTLACFLWMLGNAKTPIVVNSQPIFMYTFLAGVALTVCSIIPLSLDDQYGPPFPGICMAFPWAAGVGMTLVVVSLAVKAYRVSRVFNSKRIKGRRTRTPLYYFAFVMMITTVEIGVLIAWTVVAPLGFVRVVKIADQYGNPTESSATCTSPGSVPFLATALCLHAAQVIGLTYVSMLIRNVPISFSESRWIFFAALSLSQVYFLGLPTTVSVYNEPLGRFLVLSIIVFLSTFSILVALFYPKFMMLHYGEHYFDDSDDKYADIRSTPHVPLRIVALSTPDKRTTSDAL
jgi:hypothetical protein